MSMTLEEKKALAIENYKKAADQAGVFDSFVVKCIEEYQEKKEEKKSLFSRLIKK